MNKTVQHLIKAIVIAISLHSEPAMAQSFFTNSIKVPNVPAEIKVPEGNTAYLKGYAAGTQNYVCLPSGTGFAWRFLAPQATLFYVYPLWGTQIFQQITTHFLSPNPVEAGTARPTWQSSLDSSAVWGRATGSSIDPAYVAQGAIPWLRVEIVGAQTGPMGGRLLVETTFIHRLNTFGGIAPTSGCGASTVGNVAFVPYTTDYYFYKASGKSF